MWTDGLIGEPLNNRRARTFYNELLYRFGDVSVYDAGPYEVDFVADRMGKPSCYQVSLGVMNPAVIVFGSLVT